MDEDILTISSYFDVDEAIAKKCLIHTAISSGSSLSTVIESLKNLIHAKAKIEKYSDKSVVVRKAGIRDEDVSGMLKIGSKLTSGIRLNEYLKGGPGYIFPNYLKLDLQRYMLFGTSVPILPETRYVKKSGMFSALKKILGLSGKMIMGSDVISLIRQKILPHPDDSQTFAEIIASIDPKKEYHHIELVAMFEDMFYPRKKIGDLDVHIFSPEPIGLPKRVYWVTGPLDQVKKYIEKIEDEHPQQAFSAKIYSKGEGLASAWMEHWTTD